jgi:hypothetical protein
MNRPSIIKARVANRPTGGTAAPRTAGPKQPRGSGGTSAPAAAARGPKYGLGTGQTRGGIAPGQPLGGGPGGPPGPGVPGAPAAPASAPMPWDAQYNSSVAGADKNYGDKYAYLQSKRLTTEQNFGIDPGFNDYANNPYSRAALLRKSYDTAVRGSTNSYAAAGHLYSGSLHNAQGANRGAYDQGYDALNKEYLASLGDIDHESAQALEDRENARNEAEWQRLQTAQGEPLEPQTAPEGRGGGGSKGKKSVNHKAKQNVANARKAR